MIGDKRLSVILPAAGEGRRYGVDPDGRTKPFAEIQGRPILVHSLEPFTRSKWVDEIVISTREELIDLTLSFTASLGTSKRIRVTAGGKERQESVSLALQTIEHDGFVMVHDAVRPLITTALIDRVALEVASKNAVIVAIRPMDTIKRGTDSVEATLDRNQLWLVQTPQAFQVDLLKAAMHAAATERFVGTDESVLVERIGHPVYVVNGTRFNIKITTPEDRLFLESVLEKNILI